MSAKLLDEADINEIEGDCLSGVQTDEDMRYALETSQMRLIATLRAEQEARRRAEAQRDRLVACLRGMIGAADYDDSAPGWRSNYADGVAEEVADRARTALREIEGGEQ